ncbi:hypothetical protein GCM10009678_46520 [Actinomadura kijaniata]|uniref:Uncharacterized protein n=1 Tax=Actinomadura namibiensis TaxID=182080 RepID=A0A7W3LX32_ACTNM|nr:hypothetical protein [Actinomadura namibiensis]MBA8955893.1 hypothetical protein [Actinomadura namibiensis]
MRPGPEPPPEWRGLVNAVLYTLLFADLRDRGLADRCVRGLLTEPLLDLSPEQEYALLSDALASGGRLTDPETSIPQPHSEEEIRAFLGDVLRRMDEARPWPVPPFRSVPPWPPEQIAAAARIGRVPMSEFDVTDRIRRSFQRRTLDGRERSTLTLALSSGTEVTLITPWRRSGDVTVLVRDGEQIPEARHEFQEATGLPLDRPPRGRGFRFR